MWHKTLLWVVVGLLALLSVIAWKNFALEGKETAFIVGAACLGLMFSAIIPIIKGERW